MRLKSLLIALSDSAVPIAIPTVTLLMALPFEMVIILHPFREMSTRSVTILAPFLGGLVACPGYFYAWLDKVRACNATRKDRWWIRGSFLIALASSFEAIWVAPVFPYPLLSFISGILTAVLFAVFEMPSGS